MLKTSWLHQLGLVLSLIFGCGAELHAQATLTVTSGPLAPGSTAQIKLSDPSMANKTVQVRVDDGGILCPEFDTVTIRLNEDGDGSATWEVPASGWDTANFNATTAPEVSRAIGTFLSHGRSECRSAVEIVWRSAVRKLLRFSVQLVKA